MLEFSAYIVGRNWAGFIAFLLLTINWFLYREFPDEGLLFIRSTVLKFLEPGPFALLISEC